MGGELANASVVLSSTAEDGEIEVRISESAVRKQYLKVRSQLLQKRYGVSCDQGQSSRSMSIRSNSRISESPENSRFPTESKTVMTPNSEQGEVVPTNQADASRAIVGGTTIAENYAFVGVHHIFDQHTQAVTVVKFANNDRSRLCCASFDGTVSICNVTASPPVVDVVFRGHTKGVTACDWSVSNDLMVSCSLDGTICLWDVASRRCLRVVRDQVVGAELLSCVFQPANNNMVIVGNSCGMVEVLNVSTGIYPQGGTSKLGGRVLALACESSGHLVWAGNDKGTIISFLFDPETGRLNKGRRLNVSENCSITCISWRAWISREARDPMLLVNCAANVVYLLRVVDKEGALQVRRKFAILSGSEDSCVYFLDIERKGKPCVNTLQGHACPVLGVSFNYDESLLATSDYQGLVIVWKRERRTGGTM
uniref:Uncharacterized protein n=1 Tax=Timema bartmani TaxID=61472 RepID=A0A7R9EVX4_9NEOP|nr:unnamed protein product [Timema bartmani]